MKESFNGTEFLGQKFQDIHTSEEAQTLAEYTTKKEHLPQKKSKHATIDRYLRGLDRIMKKRPSVVKMVEESITDDYILNVQDEDLVRSLAQDLYESEKKIAIDQGRGGDIKRLDGEEIFKRYKESIIEKAQIQKRSLQSWITYLKEGEGYPIWFKYYVVRSLKKMGQFNRDSTSYSTRTEKTVAPFPEANAESLRFVFRALIGELEKEGLELNTERKDELEKELDKRLASKDFSKLYAFAQVECAGNLDRESLEGEWVIYPQGSDYRELERGLKGKGTGWCTASGSAEGQLASGDFHVFYTKNKAGIPTEPRIAVRMENYNNVQNVAEIRGVDPGQALEPVLIDIAKEHYSKLDGAEQYEKADRDMKMLTAIYEKCFKVDKNTKEKIVCDSKLSFDEVEFLFELNGPIQGFGYETDPRISEILAVRLGLRTELSKALDCDQNQIALSSEDLIAKDVIYTTVDLDEDNWDFDSRPVLPKYAKSDVHLHKKGSLESIVLPQKVGRMLILEVESVKDLTLSEEVGGAVNLYRRRI